MAKDIVRFHYLTIYDAKEKKPSIGLRVIVCGGSAFWTGKCWRSIMDPPYSGDYYEIQWEVKWWAKFPKFKDFIDIEG